jgi:hypothetical protein
MDPFDFINNSIFVKKLSKGKPALANDLKSDRRAINDKAAWTCRKPSLEGVRRRRDKNLLFAEIHSKTPGKYVRVFVIAGRVPPPGVRSSPAPKPELARAGRELEGGGLLKNISFVPEEFCRAPA